MKKNLNVGDDLGMGLKFLESFEGVEFPQNLIGTLDCVTVERVVMKKGENNLAIFIDSPRLIEYRSLKKITEVLGKQLFGYNKDEATVTLVPHFSLSAQYTNENLFDAYKESLFDEISEKSRVHAGVLYKSEVYFKDGVLVLKCENNPFFKTNLEEIGAWLKKTYDERFGFELEVTYEYYEAQKKEEPEEKVVFKNVKATEAPKKEEQEVKKDKSPVKESEKSESPKKTAFVPKNNAKFVKKKPVDDPDIFYGKPFDGEIINISSIVDGMNSEVVIRGQVLNYDETITKNGLFMIKFAVTDFTDSIGCMLFVRNEDDMPDIRDNLAVGKFIRLKGVPNYDTFNKETKLGYLVGIKKDSDFRVKRMDNSEEKRVELHLHTVMSDMDAVVKVKPLLKTLKSWGHKAVAITDHGVVQSFTEAYHCLDKNDDFKVIYGCEGYIVDDENNVVINDKNNLLTDEAVVFDIETTGFSPQKNEIIEIGAVKVKDGQIIDRFSTFINPRVPIPARITELTSITDEMVMGSRGIKEILPEFLDFIGSAMVVAHNAGFDTGFIKEKAKKLGINVDLTIVDTMGMGRIALPTLKNHKLDTLCDALNISLENHHRAVDDAEATAHIYLKLTEMFAEKGVKSLKELFDMRKLAPEIIKKLRAHHIILLAKNDIGRINLYKLVSKSHIDYFSRYPRIPKTLLAENREGIIVGSACEAGELYRAILEERGDDEIHRIANFYDYFEIQPLGNNMFMVESNKPDHERINSEDDLKDINRRIVSLGEEMGRPVVATCDVHFMNPEDEVYRRMIMTSKGFEDADKQAPLYMRTTEEMLEEFKYLGDAKAREVVITNTNLICDMIEKIVPVRPDKCPPVIENSADTLRRICYDKAHDMYGETLPKQVEERLEHELKSIIGNGFAVMYIIAQKLVWKSNEDGYLVGSRGSVGSSFVAAMAGITEVNSLPAHYYCKKCHFHDFDSEEVKAYSGRSGFDLPDRKCPVCGEELVKDGHDIPFETFLGFYGDKEPDIDLNFSGEYQSKAHAYTEVIFGEGQTFRAGTIGTVAEKTAVGFVLKYNELHGISGMRRAEMERIAQGCVDVRRTTGQHPGGIVVLPIGEEIYTFTPVQRPANDMTTSTVTTHFDYHSIDHNLLKLDILGHDDPTMIRMLQDITGIDPLKIRMDDPGVLELFRSLKSLNISPEDLDGCDLGSLGIPEFGTDFVMQMLRETKPSSFSELVRISGLSHGTDVWTNNAQDLVNQGICTLSSAICTRDDIMTYLIYMGVEAGKAFNIMENVRKGKVAAGKCDKWEGWKEDMRACNVPEWYMDSCNKIKYMFPKAHAVAYVMMALRIAWFKVYQPLAYYAAYFSIRASAFDYEVMCLGKTKLEEEMRKIKMKGYDASQKEGDMLKDMKIVQEMYARGYSFVPIDITKAEAKHFTIYDDKHLMPAINSIDGMGDKAAMGIVDALKDGPFFSKDDLKQRSKTTQTTIDTMTRLHLLDGLPDSNQISLTDLFAL